MLLLLESYLRTILCATLTIISLPMRRRRHKADDTSKAARRMAGELAYHAKSAAIQPVSLIDIFIPGDGHQRFQPY